MSDYDKFVSLVDAGKQSEAEEFLKEVSARDGGKLQELVTLHNKLLPAFISAVDKIASGEVDLPASE